MEFRYHRADGTIGVLEAVSTNRLDDPTIDGHRRAGARRHRTGASSTRRSSRSPPGRRSSSDPPPDRPPGRGAGRRLPGGRRRRPGRRRLPAGSASTRRRAGPDDDLIRARSSRARAARPARPPRTPVSRRQDHGRPGRHPQRHDGHRRRPDSLPAWLAEESAHQGFAACWAFPTGLARGATPTGTLIVWRTVPGTPSPGERVGIERAGRLLTLALERRRTEGLLLHAARHDTLTGLPNRSQFFQRLAARAAPRRAPRRRALPRPRRLQGGERPLRPPGRRRGAGRRGRAHRGRPCAPTTSPPASAATSSG